MSNDDAVLDRVVALWSQAKGHEDAAEVLESEARNEQAMSDDALDQAETLWAPLLIEHPEWRDALTDGIDPRTVVR